MVDFLCTLVAYFDYALDTHVFHSTYIPFIQGLIKIITRMKHADHITHFADIPRV